MKMSGFELKPCPFCDGTAALMRLGNEGSTHGWVECVDKKSCGASMPFRGTFEAAVALWNRREGR